MSAAGSTQSELFSATATSPFGLPLDPYEIKGRVLSTKHNVVLGTSYLLSDNIFEFNLPTLTAKKPSVVSLWANLRRANLSNIVPTVNTFDIAADSGNLILGYLKNSKNPLTVIASSDAFTQFAPILASHVNYEYHSLPLSIQLATVSYDFENNELKSDYSSVLEYAKALKLPVLTSTTAKEAQLFALVSTVLANLNVANLHIYNGFESIKTNETLVDLYSSTQLKEISIKLLNALKSEVLSAKSSAIVSLALSKLNSIAGTAYNAFTFYGDVKSETVQVVYATSESITSLVKSSNKASILVASPVPFDSTAFNDILPPHVKKVVIISEEANNSLKLDIQASLFFQNRFSIEIEEASTASLTSAVSDSSVSYKFLLNDNSKFIELPAKLAHALSLTQDLNVRFKSLYDNTINAGLFQADIDVSTAFNYSKLYDSIIVEDIRIINTVDVFSLLKKTGTLLVINSGENVFDAEKIVEKSLSVKTKKALATLSINLKFIDLNVIGDVDETKGRTQSIAIQTAFWESNLASLDKHAVVTKILQFFGSEAELLASVIADQVENVKNNGYKVIDANPEWIKLEASEDEEEEYVAIRETSFVGNPREAFIDNTSVKVEDSLELTKQLMFKEAYETKTSLRPDQPVTNFVVRVKENKRLTPNDYDRNIFHIEFDVSGTGLTYNIGEALGIHGRNNVEMVEEFISLYGNDITGNELVEVVSKDDSSVLEVRTLKQSLIENLDLFGKPPKRFYESLIEFATDEAEKKKLEQLVSPAGAALFKKFQDEEFYTFADIFELFKSVRPTAKDLVQLISPLKRREYSIASSQKLHPNEVHLLIVVVDWVDNKGRKRFGQCSKYLSDLKIGSELVVSVKPSIMKLPPLTTQPIIMAGLGTGLAPFKAFIEERQYQLEQGHQIGEIYLYLGSRHKKQEYLYGEYWESYMDADILTHLGAAFSRDQAKKVYIQDKIRENLEELQELIVEKQGHFYLCGPTWPVPDISACLQDVLKADAEKKGLKIDAAKAVEEMKEEGKYVLEVY